MCHDLLARLMIFVLGTAALATAAAANPKERIEYWQSNYEELLPTDDPRAARAHRIFQGLLRAAGHRPGIVPRLYITKRDPLSISLPIAIPDGAIILSKATLDICYQDARRGDDRLAFVLGHEISHQLEDDFWHMKFFQAIEASKSTGPQYRRVLEEIQDIAKLTEQVLAKELRADEQGIVYAAMAGFNTQSILTEQNGANFFEDWVQALAPNRIKRVQTSHTHPTTTQRAVAVKARLHQILDKVDVFQVGLWFYQSGDYQKARRAFEEFLRFFPGREVYHNLAASHHQLALQYQSLLQKQEAVLPFKLSLVVDPLSRAMTVRLRGPEGAGQEPGQMFRHHLDKAIAFYQTAISLDPAYVFSYINLGSALIVKGDVYKAIATLQDALKITPDAPEALNNLGVAFFYAENLTLAKANLVSAHERAPTYDAALFNLGKIAYEAGQATTAQQYWQAFLRLSPESPWAQLLPQRFALPLPPHAATEATPVVETVQGVAVAAFEDDLPADWRKPQSVHEIHLAPIAAKMPAYQSEPKPFKMMAYPHGITTLLQDEEILMIRVQAPYGKTSARGIAIGSTTQDVRLKYGPPPRVLDTTQGQSWVYDNQGIVFRMQHGRVVAWLLFG